MKVLCATKVGALNDSDPGKRGVIEVLDMPLREIGDTELLIKVGYCAICGSDPHQIEGIFRQTPPFGIGHEVSGTIVEMGKDAGKYGFEIGDRIGGNFRKVCGRCYYCTNAMEQFCEYATTEPGMAEYIVWDAKQAVKLPEGMSLRKGCLLEPVSIAVRVMDKAEIKVGHNVVVSGGGPIGLLTLQLAHIYGAANLTLLEPNPARRALGMKYGAKYAIDPTLEDVTEAAKRITDGRGFDICFEVSGARSAAETMLDISARAGRVVYVAQYARDYSLPLNLYDQVYAKELTITGTFVSPYTFTRTAQIMERLDLDDLTGEVFPLDEAAAAFDAHLSGKYPKVLIQCDPDAD